MWFDPCNFLPIQFTMSLGRTIREHYPDRVPMLVRPGPGAPPIGRTKFLAPGEMTVARFVAHIRQHISVARDEALFVFVGDPHRPSSMVLPVLSQTLEEMYSNHRHEDDGLLYMRYSKENTFGEGPSTLFSVPGANTR